MGYLTAPASVPETFWPRLDVGICWEWNGALNRKGYGVVKISGNTYLVHRVAYMALAGDIEDGMQLDHLCRNRRCANPDHLEPVSLRENIRRGHRPRQTHCKRGHPFDDENTIWRERSGKPGQYWRLCNRCWTTVHAKR